MRSVADALARAALEAERLVTALRPPLAWLGSTAHRHGVESVVGPWIASRGSAAFERGVRIAEGLPARHVDTLDAPGLAREGAERVRRALARLGALRAVPADLGDEALAILVDAARASSTPQELLERAEATLRTSGEPIGPAGAWLMLTGETDPATTQALAAFALDERAP